MDDAAEAIAQCEIEYWRDRALQAEKDAEDLRAYISVQNVMAGGVMLAINAIAYTLREPHASSSPSHR